MTLTWATDNGYDEFELFAENADPSLIALINFPIEECNVENSNIKKTLNFMKDYK